MEKMKCGRKVGEEGASKKFIKLKWRLSARIFFLWRWWILFKYKEVNISLKELKNKRGGAFFSCGYVVNKGNKYCENIGVEHY